MLFFTFAVLATLISSFPILAHTGLIDRNSNADYDDYSASTLFAHYIVGIICCGLVALVGLGGGITKLLNVFNFSSNSILFFRRFHTWTGYIAVILCKANIYILGEDVAVWIVIDVICVLIYIIWRLLFPKMEAKEVSPKYENDVQSVKSVH